MAELHSLDKKVICYISAGSWEEWRWDESLFPMEIQGGPLIFGPGDEFHDERWLDVRRREIILPIMLNRIGMMKHKGCDAVEWDNPDAFFHEAGLLIFVVAFFFFQIDFSAWFEACYIDSDILAPCLPSSRWRCF